MLESENHLLRERLEEQEGRIAALPASNLDHLKLQRCSAADFLSSRVPAETGTPPQA